MVKIIILWYRTGARMGRPNASLNSLHFWFFLGSLFVNLLQTIQFREKSQFIKGVGLYITVLNDVMRVFWSILQVLPHLQQMQS
jgi:hypothetical protein